MSDKQEKIDKLNASINEAERFIKKANAAKKRINSDSYSHYCSKEMASAKRSSMDLTRSLSDFRKG